MTALATERKTLKEIPQGFACDPIADNVKIWGQSLVMAVAGYAKPAATVTNGVCIGRSRQTYDNTVVGHALGALDVETEEGTFAWANGDSIVQADVNGIAYMVDDQTVSKAGTGKSPAGIIRRVDAAGVWVESSKTISAMLILAGAAEPAATLQSGTSTLVAGTKTITGVTITASSRIFVQRMDPGGTLGTDGLDVPVAGRTVGAGGTGSFVVNGINDNAATGASDTSTFDWFVIG